PAPRGRRVAGTRDPAHRDRSPGLGRPWPLQRLRRTRSPRDRHFTRSLRGSRRGASVVRGTLIGSTVLHAALLSALFVIPPARTVVLPGREVVQVARVGDVAPPAPPAPVVKANDAEVPDETDGVRIEKPRPKPKPEVKQQPKP